MKERKNRKFMRALNRKLTKEEIIERAQQLMTSPYAGPIEVGRRYYLPMETISEIRKNRPIEERERCKKRKIKVLKLKRKLKLGTRAYFDRLDKQFKKINKDKYHQSMFGNVLNDMFDQKWYETKAEETTKDISNKLTEIIREMNKKEVKEQLVETAKFKIMNDISPIELRKIPNLKNREALLINRLYGEGVQSKGQLEYKIRNIVYNSLLQKINNIVQSKLNISFVPPEPLEPCVD